jgi:hypothetical protein
MLRVAWVVWICLTLFITIAEPLGGLFAAVLIGGVGSGLAFWLAAPSIHRQPEAEHGLWCRLSSVMGGAAATTYISIPVAVHLLRASPANLELEETGCGNQVLQTIYSPDRKQKAVVFERDCGATTDFSTQISILPAGGRFSAGAGNAFVADTDHGRAPAGPGGGPKVEVTWDGSTRLLIKRHPEARIFLARRRVEGVRIRTLGTLSRARGSVLQ